MNGTRSIAKTLTIMNLLVSGCALLLACVGFFIFDQITFRQTLVHTLSAEAQIVSSSSVASLLANDPRTATNTLAALQNSSHIDAAGILTADRRPFAQYTRETGNATLTIPSIGDDQTEGIRFGATHVVVVRKLFSDGNLVGFVYIRADLKEVDERLRRYALISTGVLLISLVFALLVSSRFRKSVAEPIIELAETAKKVSRDKDYRVRVAARGDRDELLILIDAFNEMLREIQLRDNELQKARDELEERVSERTRELLSANRELESFSYSVSHDLRGPLDALNGFSYVLLKNYSSNLDTNGKESLQNIRTAAKRMSELIDDLLNLSRISTSNMHREHVDLSAFARSTMDELSRDAPSRKVEFVGPPAQEAYADPRLLRIVMDNLLRNAWKYTSHHERARIEFGSEVKNDQVIYFVKDDGSGFDPRSAGRLFQPFQRLHSTAEFPGNGIGLATVRRIIQRHGGEVWAEGAVERGATFYFTLDSRRSAAQQAASQSESARHS